MVAPYIAPDSTAQDWASWRSGLDGAIVAGARIAVAFLPQAQVTPNMTVRVLAGPLMIGGTLTEIAAQNTGTIAAPTTNPRIDRIVLNPATGAIQVVTGTEAASPVAPAIPADRLPIARFQLAVGATAITNAMIIDERVGAGGGGTATDDSFVDVASAATLDLGAQTSRSLRVTGTTAISSFGATTPTARKRWTLRFAAALTLTHNATSLILPTSANIVTEVGDTCEVAWIGGSNFVVFDYARASGQPLAAAGVPTGTVADFVGSTAPNGWVLLDGRTIGSASSAATNRANADTQALYELLWNSMANSEAPVSSGRGASAAADFAANKTIQIPDARGRVIAGRDNMGGTNANRLTSGGSGITGTTLGVAGGTETHTLSTAQMPSHTHSVSVPGGGGGGFGVSQGDPTGTSTGATGGGGAHQNTQPTLVLNKIIKL